MSRQTTPAEEAQPADNDGTENETRATLDAAVHQLVEDQFREMHDEAAEEERRHHDGGVQVAS